MSEGEELLPCPFCGAGETVVEPASKYWTGMRDVVLSWRVYHWCGVEKFTSRLEFKAKTREEAVAKWNRRV